MDLSTQRLTVWEGERVAKQYLVSTGANGIGEIQGSGCTPRGRHRVRAKIGAGAPAGTVFRGRRVARELPLCTAEALAAFPDRDWITSRILWLSGLEPGRNRLGCVDSMRRYIYIHGTPHRAELGRPASHGCIRMADADVIELFDLVPLGTQVDLHE
ncbi:MAG: L,D-transpeptidase [Stagnimonas sp.]|nr:L,D-transpeptidase [Stagnimonas sp.]